MIKIKKLKGMYIKKKDLNHEPSVTYLMASYSQISHNRNPSLITYYTYLLYKLKVHDCIFHLIEKKNFIAIELN